MKKRRSLTLEQEEAETSEPSPWRERCMNPWNGRCTSTNIALYIMYKGKRLPICRRCWRDISARNIEWVYD